MIIDLGRIGLLRRREDELTQSYQKTVSPIQEELRTYYTQMVQNLMSLFKEVIAGNVQWPTHFEGSIIVYNKPRRITDIFEIDERTCWERFFLRAARPQRLVEFAYYYFEKDVYYDLDSSFRDVQTEGVITSCGEDFQRIETYFKSTSKVEELVSLYKCLTDHRLIR